MNAVARCFLTFGLATALASVPLIASADDPQPPSPLPAGGCPLTGVEPFINFVLERTGVGSMELDCQGAQATPTPPTATPTPPPAATATPAPTATPTETPGGASPTPPPTATASPSPTASPTATASPSPSPSPTVLPEERPAEAPRVGAQLAQLPSTSTGGGR